MTAITELETPAVTVHLNVMADNIRRVQAHLTRHGLGNRPHIKTHKIPAIGQMQMAAGAVGITCQKLGEVEVFADAKVADDVLLTYNILGAAKTERLMALARRVPRLAVVFDNEVVARELSAAAARHQVALEFLVECDTGFRRTGVQTPDEAFALARTAMRLPGLQFKGLMTFPNRDPDTREFFERALALFRKSVLKQAKFEQISSLLEDPQHCSNLDLGGDNGVLSYLLRQKGGTWSSGDLDEKTVGAIRRLVGDRVYRLDGSTLPFPDDSLDQIVVIDYLEHVPEDQAAVREFRRVLKPGGILIVNVPRPKPGSLLTKIRDAIGLTDQWHGHVRPGYTEDELGALLAPAFALETVRTYSRSFSEAIDTGLNGVYQLLRGKGAGSSRKGTVITGHEVQSNQRAFQLMALLHPVMWAVSRLDYLLVGQAGYKMVARARLVAKSPRSSHLDQRLEQARDIAPALMGS